MFWRDIGLDSIFDHWFGQWSEAELTGLAGAMGIACIVALRATQKSQAEYRRRHSRDR
jgi:hypothetical protein